jgi:hypothetical protein
MRLAWHRHGVPQSIIDYLVEMDIDGPTIVRTPKAAKTWEERPYACVDSPHQPFDIDDPVTQLLDSFTADRGTGQGDVSSPASWNAVFDILLTALQRDEISQTSTRQLQAADQTMYTSTETAYVDDLVSCCLTPEQIQRKADIVSAFCLITGIIISIDKLRRVVHTWSRRVWLDTTRNTSYYRRLHLLPGGCIRRQLLWQDRLTNPTIHIHTNLQHDCPHPCIGHYQT